MKTKPNSESSIMYVKLRAAFAAIVVAITPAVASAAWQTVATEQGKRVEIERSSIVAGPNNTAKALGRIVLDKPIVDTKTSSSYQIIEVESRYACAERTSATLKRSYFKEDGELLRQEEIRAPFDMPVRSGTPDDKLLREVCRPKPGSSAEFAASKTAEKVGEVAGELRKANEALIEKEVNKDLQKTSSRAAALLSGKRVEAPRERRRPAAPAAVPVSEPMPTSTNTAWAYGGDNGPDSWGQLTPKYATCASGHRQAPIDIRDGIAVDLEPIKFAYHPAAFRVSGGTYSMQVDVYGGGLDLFSKHYDLEHIQFHRPAEITIEGKTFAMDAQLMHRSADGKQLIVVVLLEKGTENPVVQMALNNLPLEKGDETALATQSLDVNRLLSDNQHYFAFMGSLTTPPCTEDVTWLVLKQVQQISPEQLAIFQRLYKPNARPTQPLFGRIIKESR